MEKYSIWTAAVNNSAFWCKKRGDLKLSQLKDMRSKMATKTCKIPKNLKINVKNKRVKDWQAPAPK